MLRYVSIDERFGVLCQDAPEPDPGRCGRSDTRLREFGRPGRPLPARRSSAPKPDHRRCHGAPLADVRSRCLHPAHRGWLAHRDGYTACLEVSAGACLGAAYRRCHQVLRARCDRTVRSGTTAARRRAHLSRAWPPHQNEQTVKSITTGPPPMEVRAHGSASADLRISAGVPVTGAAGAARAGYQPHRRPPAPGRPGRAGPTARLGPDSAAGILRIIRRPGAGCQVALPSGGRMGRTAARGCDRGPDQMAGTTSRA